MPGLFRAIDPTWRTVFQTPSVIGMGVREHYSFGPNPVCSAKPLCTAVYHYSMAAMEISSEECIRCHRVVISISPRVPRNFSFTVGARGYYSSETPREDRCFMGAGAFSSMGSGMSWRFNATSVVVE